MNRFLNLRIFLFCISFLLCFGNCAFAQVFGDDIFYMQDNGASVQKEDKKQNQNVGDALVDEDLGDEIDEEGSKESEDYAEEDFELEEETPQKPAVQPQSGNPNKIQLIDSVLGEDETEENKIFLYYKDFKISKAIDKHINCTMTFYVRSTLPEKVSAISYQLKWPDMETPISFDNIQPYETKSIVYTLLGKGCYNMATLPNIIVNRCRIKNVPQSVCASLIRWKN